MTLQHFQFSFACVNISARRFEFLGSRLPDSMNFPTKLIILFPTARETSFCSVKRPESIINYNSATISI